MWTKLLESISKILLVILPIISIGLLIIIGPKRTMNTTDKFKILKIILMVISIVYLYFCALYAVVLLGILLLSFCMEAGPRYDITILIYHGIISTISSLIGIWCFVPLYGSETIPSNQKYDPVMGVMKYIGLIAFYISCEGIILWLLVYEWEFLTGLTKAREDFMDSQDVAALEQALESHATTSIF